MAKRRSSVKKALDDLSDATPDRSFKDVQEAGQEVIEEAKEIFEPVRRQWIDKVGKSWLSLVLSFWVATVRCALTFISIQLPAHSSSTGHTDSVYIASLSHLWSSLGKEFGAH